MNGDVNLSNLKLSKIPIKFGRVSGYFHCLGNSLITLDGSPSYVGGYFVCRKNRLISFEGAPSYVGLDFYCNGNPIHEVYSLFNTPKCFEPINEYDVIQGRSIILSRLEEVYHDLKMQIPDKFNFKYYRLID